MVAYLERSACDDGLVGATYLVLAMVRLGGFGGIRYISRSGQVRHIPWVQA